MKPETRRHMFIMTSSSVGITILTLIVTLGFFEETPLNIVRNVVIANILFLSVYWSWLKIYGNYQKMYKLGLNE